MHLCGYVALIMSHKKNSLLKSNVISSQTLQVIINQQLLLTILHQIIRDTKPFSNYSLSFAKVLNFTNLHVLGIFSFLFPLPFITAGFDSIQDTLFSVICVGPSLIFKISPPLSFKISMFHAINWLVLWCHSTPHLKKMLKQPLHLFVVKVQFGISGK